MDLKSLLDQYILTVDFIKKDGTPRQMICTRIPDLLPETKGNTRETPDNIVTVYDLEAEGWRSINLDTLVNWEIID